MLKIVKTKTKNQKNKQTNKKTDDHTYINFIIVFTKWQDKAATRHAASGLHSADFCSASESVQQIFGKENGGV